jgi:hypothetical protein
VDWPKKRSTTYELVQSGTVQRFNAS